MAPDRATGGYWLVASDGGVFAFGAPFEGSTGSLAPQPPGRRHGRHGRRTGLLVRGLRRRHLRLRRRRPSGAAPAPLPLNAPVVGMAADPATGGYWLVGADGGVFAYGAPFFGAG